MAVYVTSDLHGFSMEKFKQLLSVIGFSDRDWLYILGDVIDRNNDGGVAILQWLLDQPNVQLIRGNHEEMLLCCSWLFEEITDQSLDNLSAVNTAHLSRWMRNGAEPTIESMKHLLHTEPETVAYILEYLNETPLCETVEVGERSFLLCHGGLKDFDKSKKLSDYFPHDLLWHRPMADERYFDDVTTILGHTPTRLYGCDGRAFVTDTWIDIDVGVSNGRPPMFLRLDDLKEIYF